MKKRCLIFLVLFFTQIAAFAYAKDPGETFYPTRLEWFVMDLNAKNKFYDSTDSKFSLSYYALNSGTIVLDVLYYGDVNKLYMDKVIDNRLKLIRRLLEIDEIIGVNVTTDVRPMDNNS